MQAMVVRSFGGPDVLSIESVPIPSLGSDQVLVRVHAAGVNPIDTYIRAGAYGKLPMLPYTPGMDGAGVVEVSQSPKIKVGSRVYVGRSVTGTYAQFAVCDSNQVHALPERVSFAQGAAIHVPYWTAMQAIVHKARAKPGEWVLIHGASGGVGLAAVQIARQRGLRVIATAGSAAGLELLKTQGAVHVFNHHDAELVSKVHALTKFPEGGVDIVLEMLANVNLEKDLAMMAMRGRIVVIGNRGRIEINPRDAMSRDATICGMSLLNSTEEEKADLARMVGVGLDSGELTPVVRSELALAEAPRAHQLVLESGAAGKLVLRPWAE
ncbi:MAG: NADPH:quinone reductase [Planctomycetes bacterium]|nr:NADPH:quinone reductase [Planctomycetota bacterium]